MASLADLERFLERVFERSTARLFRTHVQVVQLERRVERAMERARLAEHGRTSVPSRYRVRLNPSDLADAAGQVGGADTLAGRLADAALAFARSHAYHLSGRPTVSLVADPSLASRQVEVDAVAEVLRRPSVGRADPGRQDRGSRAQEWPAADPAPAPATMGAPGAPGSPAGTRAGPVMPGTAAAASAADAPDHALPATPPGPMAEVAFAVARPPDAVVPPLIDASPPGIRGDGTQTMVFRRPAPAAARAVLRAFAPDGSERTIEVDGTPLTIGRARDNGLVLADSRVSRHHGRLQARRGALVYTDLGSTNGSRVNGVRVDEIVLGAGDRLQVGDTVLVVETLPG